jgi:hypothetical protein
MHGCCEDSKQHTLDLRSAVVVKRASVRYSATQSTLLLPEQYVSGEARVNTLLRRSLQLDTLLVACVSAAESASLAEQ